MAQVLYDFMAEIRAMPVFIEAAKRDPVFLEHADAIEYAFDCAGALANEQPAWIDRLDRCVAIVGRGDLTTQEKLLAIGREAEAWHLDHRRKRGH